MIDSGDAGSSVERMDGSPRIGEADNGTERKRPPPLQAEATPGARDEGVNVRLELLDQLLKNTGEVSIYRARMAQQNKTVVHKLEEFTQTLKHMRKRLCGLELETEFDELSKALSEDMGNLSDVSNTLVDLSRDTDIVLLQQASMTSDLQDGLLHARGVSSTPAIADVLLVKVADQLFAIPHGDAQGIIRAKPQELMACYAGKSPGITHAGHEYPVRYMGTLMGMAEPVLSHASKWYPLLLVESVEERRAIQLDQLLGSVQVMVQPLGAQLDGLRWFTGGTILADGDIALLLDLNILLDSITTQEHANE